VLVLDPPLKGAPLLVIVCFLGPSTLEDRHFEERLVGREEDLERRLKISMNAPICGA